VNLPLDVLGDHISDLGPLDRDIVVYCASGARSAYAQRILMQVGYSNVRNGGGIMDMMYSR
jgi:rhodanese-related sulfurtransferase